ncbi:MAG: hypothetical protein IPG45_03255 [Deltaproteobacteria bacterium]|nr:hypothetical protein [Deltaproteobacteria bacterium]
MNDPQDTALLLRAIAQFLEQQLRPALSEPSLIFRLKIATHLLETLAREQAEGPALAAADAARLEELLGPVPDPEAALWARIESGAEDPALRKFLLERLGAELAVTQPRFDRTLTPEAP